jgi:peptidoglycan/xylan/chitin deacetylase (PgdA/CDA1 family)
VWSLKDSADRQAVFQAIRGPMKFMPSARRQLAMNSIREQFPAGETERLLNQFPSQQMLSWKEVAQLAGAGVEIGSHGVNHEVHHSRQPESVRVGELVTSKSVLERELKRPCRFFAYPNGDFSPTSAGEVCAAGFELAFTSLSGMIKPESNPYLLPRLYPNGSPSRFRPIFWNELS